VTSEKATPSTRKEREVDSLQAALAEFRKGG